VKQIAGAVAPFLRLAVLPPYFNRPEYVNALVASASPYLDQEFDHLLFSFHGLPQRHIRKANPACGECLRDHQCSSPGAQARVCYRRHCLETVKQFLAMMPIAAGKVSYSFQSRLGMDAWLEPNTHS
jgi:ferrochelatase